MEANAATDIANGPASDSLPPPAFVAASLLRELQESTHNLVYVASSELAATQIASAVMEMNPIAPVVMLPAWDCLPYDRAPPSRHSMGRRMDALRVWLESPTGPKLLVTSLEAMVQKVPPLGVIRDTWYRLAIGESFDITTFLAFAKRTGYYEDGNVDEPGEFAFRDGLIDIFPAGGRFPVRVTLRNTLISELWFYDPTSQRTTKALEEMVFGPASEAVIGRDEEKDDPANTADAMYNRLFRQYGELPSAFDILENVKIALPDQTFRRLPFYLELIDDARHAHVAFGGRAFEHSLYIDEAQWTFFINKLPSFAIDTTAAQEVPQFSEFVSPGKALRTFVEDHIRSGWTIVLAGESVDIERATQRLVQQTGFSIQPIGTWLDHQTAPPGSLLRLSRSLHHGFIDHHQRLAMLGTADIVGRAIPTQYSQVGINTEPDLELGDLVVHEDYGIGRLCGLETVEVEGETRDAARLVYYGEASILVPTDDFGKIWRYGSNATAVPLDRLHTDGWKKKRALVDKDIRAAVRHLKKAAENRQASPAQAVKPPRARYARFASRFPYGETPDQAAAIQAVMTDLASGVVMNRLVCGDVGFGKTEVALRAAAAVALAGGQVVVVSPTTVLTRQHFVTFSRRFAGMGIEVAMLSRVVSPKEAKRVKAGLKNGDISVVVATQAILAKDISLPRLWLLIIDEEHRFGVRDKQALQELAPAIHTIMMSATPIPRTLQTALIGIQDTSLLTAPPAERRPARTVVTDFDKGSLRVALLREYRRGGQSFIVTPRIEDIEELRAMLANVVPELTIRVAHGKMRAVEMDEIMVDFADGHGDVLLATNIVESGLDVPRANTMFIWRADRFGLAQLYQLRGRVGRSKVQGICYLILPPDRNLADATRSRLSTILDNDRLGDGLSISLDDLELRGGGEIEGDKQSGHLKVIGTALYQDLLERAISGRKESGQSKTDVNLGISGAIPGDYVSDAGVRLGLYSRLLRADSLDQVEALAEEFDDRFGDLPVDLALLLRLTSVRVAAQLLGIRSVEGGPKGIALTFNNKDTRHIKKHFDRIRPSSLREGRLIFEERTNSGEERLALLEQLLDVGGR
ncbi:DEAD/DEAH box helicase [Rhizobium sp. BK176]|uniref:DEAD/DEAH box helicase n=1 Tax=Rhizobium sp. BK176 TaxID=2587071 RepID=UPI0021692ED0|nr:DEAD/DEAH box helicase [Rhizobium sp. BK176]MCS4093657.1 transcription-repair coupling factor (superfamily II helicase) [Rhizobium sp. BK176]